MSIKGGPHIETDGLVLYYDVDNVDSYPGEPTTNIATDSLTQGGWSGAWSLVDSDTKTFLTDVRYTSVHNPWRSYYYSIAGQAGNTVTITCDYEVISEVSGSLNAFYLGQGNTGTYPNYIPGSGASNYSSTTSNGPQRLTWTGVINAAEYIGWTMTGTGLTSGGIVTIQISNLQVEVKSHATPFVNGTRSTTDGLKDLSGNANHADLSNASYDSSALIDYDGASYTDLGASSNIGTFTTISVSAWINPDNITGWNGVMGALTGGEFIHFQIYNQSPNIYVYGPNAGKTAAAQDINIGEWSQVGFTFDGSYIRYFFNGELVDTSAIALNPDVALDATSIVSIGRVYSADRYFGGKVDIVKIYNRELSSKEFLTNYNAQKSRFGL